MDGTEPMTLKKEATHRSNGFTLIELMIAVMVIAILAVMATVSYHRYAYRSRRTDAHHMLMTIAHSEERWYATYNRYTDNLSKLGQDVDANGSPHAYYELALIIGGGDAQTYEATATPINAQATDICGVLTIDNAGRKTPAREDMYANANGSCW